MATVNAIEEINSQEIEKYWLVVRKTLEQVFHENTKPADQLRQAISTCSAEERLLFYHAEPLHIAASLVDKRPTSDQIAEYRILANTLGWQ